MGGEDHISHACMTGGTYMVGEGRKDEGVTGNGAITLKSLSWDKGTWRIVVV